ncbi:MAG: redox-sensing transcriptional repressor Rex [bacterium]
MHKREQEARISDAGVARLAQYYRVVSNLGPPGRRHISSQELGRITGHSAAQVRKDLSCFGSFGSPGVGYDISDLSRQLGRILGKQKEKKVLLVGVGHLGSALFGYKRLRNEGFNVVALFDNDGKKIGKKMASTVVRPMEDLERVATTEGIDIGIVTVPASSAQRVVDQLIACGIKAILNFAPTTVSAPKNIAVQNVDLSIELDRLSYMIGCLS